MRKFFLFLVILLLLSVGLAPYVDGLLFKRQFDQQIQFIQQALNDSGKKYLISVDHYESGWLSSKAIIAIRPTKTDEKVTANHQGLSPIAVPNQFKTLQFSAVIQHGPIIHANGKFVPGLAYITASPIIPKELSEHLPNKGHNIILVNTFIGFDRHKWETDYTIAGIQQGNDLNWDGAKGHSTVIMNNNRVVSLQNTLNFSRISGEVPYVKIQFSIEPMTFALDITQQNNNDWIVKYNTVMSGASAKMKGDHSLEYQSATIDNLLSNNHNMFTEEVEINLAGFKSTFGNLKSISKLKYHAALKDFNSSEITKVVDLYSKAFLEYSQRYGKSNQSITQNIQENDLLSVLTSSSSIESSLTMNTNLGDASGSISISLSDIPKEMIDLMSMTNLKVEAKINKSYLAMIATTYYEYLAHQRKRQQYIDELYRERTSSHTIPYDFKIRELLNFKKITQDEYQELASLQNKNPSDEDITILFKEMPITATQAEELKQIYWQDKKRGDKNKDSVTAESSITEESPAIQAENFINQLIKNEIVISKGDDLHLNLDKSGDKIILNGKSGDEIRHNLMTLMENDPKPSLTFSEQSTATDNTTKLSSNITKVE